MSDTKPVCRHCGDIQQNHYDEERGYMGSRKDSLCPGFSQPVTLPDLPKPLRTSKHWDEGIEWHIAGERAARLEREDQLRQAISDLSHAEAENQRLRAALEEAKEFVENLQLPDDEWSRVLDLIVAALSPTSQPDTDKKGNA